MPTYPTLDFSDLAAGHDGPPIPESLITYFTERWRWRLFEFLLERFEQEEANGLNQAKLARRIGRSKEVVNRWLASPSNLTSDSVAALMLGIAAEEPTLTSISVLNREPRNYEHLDEEPEVKLKRASTSTGSLSLRV